MSEMWKINLSQFTSIDIGDKDVHFNQLPFIFTIE